MATQKSVWGIDIGQVALKALKLRSVDGELQVEAFDIIEHPKILSQPDADRDQLIRVALEQFLARNNIADSAVAVSVPGQASFTRFVKLPPVEEKKIPDIVRFEAEQQIPFPINDVIWRWQTFHDANSPEVELGIFAMKRVDVEEMLSHFGEVEMPVDCVQMAPLSLYNFMTFDGQLAEEGATLLIDVGADKTDLVVADGPRIWTRTVHTGGNNFTEALVRAFKLSFAKAEKLKRTAASSKYARQIFQAMRPVFSDLVQEIQKSVGYYMSLHRETRFKRVVGLGNGFRLPGLQKFLEQNLNIPVVRIDNYNKLTPSSTVNAPTFTENVLSFAVAYGLALQGLGLTTVSTNLLPQEVSRERTWQRKKPWFAAAAACLLGVIGLYSYSQIAASSALQPTPKFDEAQKKVKDLEDIRKGGSVQATDWTKAKDQITSYFKMYGYHDTWPTILQCMGNAISSEFRDQAAMKQLGTADQPAFEQIVKDLSKAPRNTRELLYVDRFASQFTTDIDSAAFPAATGADGTSAAPAPASPAAAGASAKQRPGFVITISGKTPLSNLAANTKLLALREKIVASFKESGLEVVDVPRILHVTPGGAVAAAAAAPTAAFGTPFAGGGAVAGPANPDPLFPSEDMLQDTSVSFAVKVAVPSDGVKVPDDPAKTH